MTDNEKEHEIREAYGLIRDVKNDTDEDLWAYEFLEKAMNELYSWFEEADI